MCYYGIVLILYLVQRPLILGSFYFFIFILLSLFAMIFDVGEMLLQGLQWLGWWSQVFIIVGVKWRYPKITNFRMDFCHTQINNKEVVMEI